MIANGWGTIIMMERELLSPGSGNDNIIFTQNTPRFSDATTVSVVSGKLG
jgi:hypothetical protein